MTGKDNLLGGRRGPLVVSGLGILSAAGRGMDSIHSALAARRSFLARLPRERCRWGRDGPAPLVGLVPDAVIADGTGRHGTERRGGRSVRLAAAALRDAMEAARASGARPRPERTGVALGTALGAAQDVELDGLAGGGGARGGAADDLSFAVFADRVVKSASDSGPDADGTSARGESFLSGPRSVFSATCVSGLCALEQAAADIALDRADAMAVGGIDTLSDVMLAGFASLGIVSGSGQLHPFGGSGDGIAIGEAACFIVIEPLSGAGEPFRSPRACILSQSLESDAYHLTTPDPSGRGMARAIERAVADAGMTAGDLGGILVTAAGSAVYDRGLSRAVEAALGPRAREIPVSTWEPAVGHVLAATGIVALAFAAEVLGRGRLPAVYPVSSAGETRLRAIDPECRLDYVVDGPRSLDEPVLLALVVGFGGQNGAVVMACPDRAASPGRAPE